MIIYLPSKPIRRGTQMSNQSVEQSVYMTTKTRKLDKLVNIAINYDLQTLSKSI